jgi:hypothetical protein
VLGEHSVNLLNPDVDLFQSLSQDFNFLCEALELGSVNHRIQPCYWPEVEEGGGTSSLFFSSGSNGAACGSDVLTEVVENVWLG